MKRPGNGAKSPSGEIGGIASLSVRSCSMILRGGDGFVEVECIVK